MHAVECRP